MKTLRSLFLVSVSISYFYVCVNSVPLSSVYSFESVCVIGQATDCCTVCLCTHTNRPLCPSLQRLQQNTQKESGGGQQRHKNGEKWTSKKGDSKKKRKKEKKWLQRQKWMRKMRKVTQETKEKAKYKKWHGRKWERKKECACETKSGTEKKKNDKREKRNFTHKQRGWSGSTIYSNNLFLEKVRVLKHRHGAIKIDFLQRTWLSGWWWCREHDRLAHVCCCAS